MFSFHRSYAMATVLIGLSVSGCGGDSKDANTDTATGDTEAPAAAAADVPNAAKITGTVSFAGTAPAPAKIDMTEEKVCADKHSGGAISDEVVVKDGKLANVFVYVKSGLSAPQTTTSANVVMDQDGCMYKPHVFGVQVGQPVVIKNSDGLLHNIKAQPSANRPFNISQPTNMETTRSFDAKEIMIPVECNVHSWMKAYVGVMDHPYFATSGDNGQFEIGNLPPGTYELEAWHEKYGTQTASVTVGPDETKDVVFNFSPGTANRVPLGKPLVIAANHEEHAAR
jgi:plastocyanin